MRPKSILLETVGFYIRILFTRITYLFYLDLNKKIASIEYNSLPKKVDKETLEKLEKELKDKAIELERELLKLKLELQRVGKMHERVAKEIQAQKKKEENPDRDEVSLIKRPLMGYKCANCERDLNNLENTQTQFYNWKKMPKSHRHQSVNRNAINMNLHNIGQGFSKMLQTFSTDSLNNDLLRSSLMEEEEPENTQG